MHRVFKGHQDWANGANHLSVHQQGGLFFLCASRTHGWMFMRADRHIYVHIGMHHVIIYMHTRRNTHALTK